MRVRRIAGFELRIHWSTLVIFGLLVWSLATVRLPEQTPGASQTAYLMAALISGLAFYGALLAHETSHALVARREGMEVESLTLWVLGGMAALRGEPRTPGADLRIAAVGPAISLALAAAFALLAAGVGAAGGPELVVATLGWLAGINGVLGIFNLVPAAPLDGGRILRAALWAWRGDRSWAAIAAGRAGQVFGYLLIGLGFLGLFSPRAGGFWFLLLGWFLVNAARAEEVQTVLRDALGDVRVASVMTPDPLTAPADANVADLLDDYVLRTRHNAFPVRDATGRPVGLVTLSRLRTVPPDRRGVTRVAEVACPVEELATARLSDRLVDLLPRLNACGEGRALVVDDGRLVGIVTPADVTRAVEVAGVGAGQTEGTPR
jgi:Zn-dependent protease/CBS domain-containing protein